MLIARAASLAKRENTGTASDEDERDEASMPSGHVLQRGGGVHERNKGSDWEHLCVTLYIGGQTQRLCHFALPSLKLVGAFSGNRNTFPT